MVLDVNSVAAKAMYEHVGCCRYGAMELPGCGQVADTKSGGPGLVLVVDGSGYWCWFATYQHGDVGE